MSWPAVILRAVKINIAKINSSPPYKLLDWACSLIRDDARPLLQVPMLLRFVDPLLDCGFREKALDLIDNTHTIARHNVESPGYKSLSLQQVAEHYTKAGMRDAALRVMEKALAAARREKSDKELRVLALGMSAVIFYRLQIRRRALLILEQATDLSWHLPEKGMVVGALIDLAQNYVNIGLPYRGAALMDLALKKYGSDEYRSNWGNLAAGIFVAAGHYNKAAKMAALVPAKRTSNWFYDGIRIANSYIKLGQNGKAIAILNKLLSMTLKIKMARTRLTYLYNLGQSYDSSGQYFRVIKHFPDDDNDISQKRLWCLINSVTAKVRAEQLSPK